MVKMTQAKKAKKSPSTKGVDEGLLMHIQDQKENWSECTLEDGTKVRIRPVITEVRKLSQLGLDGKPAYGVKTALITDVLHPEKRKGA